MSDADLMQNPVWYKKWWSQCKLLLWKNWRISIRNQRGTITQMCAPAAFIIILFILQNSIQGNTQRYDFFDKVHHQDIKSIENIPHCVVGPDNDQCWTMVYSPNNSAIADEIMRLVAQNNHPPIPQSSIRAFATPQDIDTFLYENLNTTQSAVLWDIQFDGLGRVTDISYVLQINQTSQYSHGIEIKIGPSIFTPTQYAIDKAIVEYLAANQTIQVEYEAKIVNFAHPEILTVNIIGEQGPIWFFAALMFNFVVGVGAIVQEKEQKLRAIMQIMGLYDSVYWLTWFITLTAYSTATVMILIVFGCIFQFHFFLKNAFGLYFFLMELFALSLVSMTFLISTIVKKASNSTGIGFLIFILGFFIQIASAIVYSDSASPTVRNLFSLFSPAVFTVGLQNLGLATEKESYQGLRWSSVNDQEAIPGGVISFAEIYGWLILDFFLYLIIALYLDNVMPNAYGVSRRWYYFLTPSYWTGKSRPSESSAVKSSELTETELKDMDEDVKAERDSVVKNDLPAHTAVVVNRLTKIYEAPNKCCGCTTGDPYLAVNELCLNIQSDTLLCLLGPNGAGKTTTIHMLVGFHGATAGDATIFGHSVTENVQEVQKMIGLCPQFDILWNELTGVEHLYLFAGLRNIPKDKIEAEATRLLEEVELTEAAHVRSTMYSGGMRRRLSVAISLIGNPRIVFLDEPTTGMDPVSRRKVWNTIERAKKDKVIVLTTHSMEEADVLGDKIAIMAKGRLQCVGSSLRLKQRFGAGYRVAVGTHDPLVNDVIKYFESNITGAKVQGKPVGGYVNFTIPRTSNKELVPFFDGLEQHKQELGIHDLQLSLTTLEEVFLTVAEHAELKKLTQFMVDQEETSPDVPKKKRKFSLFKKHHEDEDLEAQSDNHVRRRDQFKALFIKSWILQKREVKTNICQILTPIILIIALYLLNLLVNNIIDPTPIPKILNPETTLPFHFLSQPSITDNWWTVREEVIANGSILPYTYKDGSLGDYAAGTGFLGLLNPPATEQFPHKFDEFSEFGRTLNDSLEESSHNMSIHYQYFSSKDAVDDFVYDSHDSGFPQVVGGYVFDDNFNPSTYQFIYAVMYNFSLTFARDIPFFVNRMTNAVGKTLPFPISIIMTGLKTFPSESKSADIDLVTLAGSFFYILILHQLFPVFMANIVYEKESKIKDMMDMMGLKTDIYWIVTYIFDLILYVLVILFLILARKVYPALDGNPPKVAVQGVSFGVDQNSCLGVLGHNGAGKTTTINMLIGLIEPTAGNAIVRGKSLVDDLNSIYTFIGICPQHDILWDNLTGKEHLEFYGRIKNLKGKELKRQIKSILQKVNLYDARNKYSTKYSGGMKRRLSVAISLIGNPKVIYLDEPSTGLDPKSRQDLWGVINEAKQTASVLLTTHSMEEADAICDRLMIMADGEIQCIGVSADLKKRFGEGYKLSVQVARGMSDQPAHEFIKKLIPEAILLNELAGTRNYEVSKEHVTLEAVFKAMEENKDKLNITDWAITNTTLEEVFLKISMEEEAQKKKRITTTITMELPRPLSKWLIQAALIQSNMSNCK